MTLDKFFKKSGFHNENDYVEYVNMYLITALATLLYCSYCVIFALSAYSDFLFVTQILSILACAAAFTVNRALRNPRAASIIMILLVSASINIWAFSMDVGGDLRWYAILALCPMYFFSSIVLRDKIWLTALVGASFLSASIISYYHVPLADMPNSELFNTVSSCVILISVALELIIYKYANNRKDDELKRIGTVLENIECGIAIVDAETHTILDINPVAARIYGGTKESVVGKMCHKLICPASGGSCPITDKNQTVNRSERVLVKADGTTIPIIKSVAKIWYDGRLALLESFTDISDLKEAEEKLRLMEVTERANRAKSEFLSRMSHEMRTPMNAIIGMTKIAEGTEDVERLKYCLATIGVSSAHLLDIINDILDMSKIEAGKFELDSLPLDIEKILMKTSRLVAEQIERKKIKLGVYIEDGTSVHCIGDELRLSQVIANLLSNAVKFTPDGGAIKLTVEETQKEADCGVFRFTVADTGIGMSAEQMSRLFNAFEQADGSITRQFGGTGLGLAISKGIVEKMDGKIWAESTPGKGSTFTVEVKLRHTERQKGVSAPREKRPELKVLVAEPDADTRSYLMAIAAWYGAGADKAENAEELSALIRLAAEAKKPYDTVFLAYAWPDTNGIEMLSNLTASIDKSSIVLMTSFLNWNRIESVAHSAGVRRFIPLPLFPSTVWETITGGPEAATGLEPNGAVPDFSGMTLLLAEDVELNREIFTALLEDTKIRIDIAENGAEAVRKFSDAPERYAVIVMDIQMPVMNGYEATRQIRALGTERAKSIPIIAMSADAFQEDIDRCLESGMNDHLKKPIELDTVMEKLRFYCKT